MSSPAGARRSSAGGSRTALARRGFDVPAQVEGRLVELGLWDVAAAAAPAAAAATVAALLATADPDLAVRSLSRLVEAGADPLAEIAEDPGLRARLVGVLGASSPLGDHLVAHLEQWTDLRMPDGTDRRPADRLRADLLRAVGAEPDEEAPRARGAESDVVEDLRTAYRRALVAIAARDVTGALDLPEVADELADLAAGTVEAALAMARSTLSDDAPPCRLAVIGMGKCGGQELNYVSDVDVIFVVEPVSEEQEPTAALRTGGRLASRLIRICGEVAWPVDAALRPEGKNGPLVRTVDSHVAYYRRWAKTWEFQALIKARPIAGDAEIGAVYVAQIAPMVWAATEREDVVEDIRAMRRRVEQTLPASTRDRELKLGPGGLRDVEFAVQLLQLVHGRSDPDVRSGSTLDALDALARKGYVGRADAATLAEAYRWLRRVEHALQLYRLRRTHEFPDDENRLRVLAAAMGYRAASREGAVQALRHDRARYAAEVRRLHEKLFYRPLLQAVSRLPTEELRLSPDAARERLALLGFADPKGAMRHLEALTAGLSRRAAVQRALLPVMLAAFSDSADPDAGLLAYRQVSEALGETPWYLRLLRDQGTVAERLAYLLGTSRYVTSLLTRAPEALRMLADDAQLRPRTVESLRTAMTAAADRADTGEAAVQAVRALRRVELLRVACADLLGLLDGDGVGRALCDVVDAVIGAMLGTARREVTRQRGAEPPCRMAVIGMGRYGGQEAGYGSDADVLFVHAADPGAADAVAASAAADVAEQLRRLLSLPGPDPALELDADLRPEGRGGHLSRSVASYAAYYRSWGSVWEDQALLRARPVAGDAELAGQLMTVLDGRRYPEGGLAREQVLEIRRIKARVDTERLPRGADPATHTKLGRGGLADVEWAVQLLQLQHAAEIPELRTTGTLGALTAAVDALLVQPADAEAMAEAWRLASRVRNAVMLVRGRAGDQLPRRGRELTGVARAVGYPPGEDPGEFEDDYLRAARRSRAAVERVFYE